ncbi:glycosyl hydrolase 108 family protein [uncultured Pontibacter sp.]|uniref:glycoside hydrolase family 108 protein n=1 Tax=uncultured Pontibacter sp. TaxID=453356 RepID=UPI00262E2E9A|nr:glycosyl hydrolase 108 family protein [uncultured Pontibacter sp.]
MANYDISYRALIPREGGYANVPGDMGKETYQGISRKFWPNWPGWALIDAIKAVRPLEQGEVIHDYNLKVLVKNFYRQSFWNTMLGNSIKNQQIADILFDSHVLMGGNGIEVAQRVLRQLGFAVDVDGVVGTKQTLPALNNVDANLFYQKFKEARKAYHIATVNAKPSQGKFLKGWLSRVDSFPDSIEKKTLA